MSPWALYQHSKCLYTLADSLLEPLKVCSFCHCQVQQYVVLGSCLPFLWRLFCYASLAWLWKLSSRTLPRSWCDAHLCIDELFQSEGVHLSKQLCNVWAGAGPRYAWMQGEQCQWPWKSRYFIFLLLSFFLVSNRGTGVREQRSNISMWCLYKQECVIAKYMITFVWVYWNKL